ncbi:MAG: hypothetical protein ACI82G_000528 [Bradymonadia bacterium]
MGGGFAAPKRLPAALTAQRADRCWRAIAPLLMIGARDRDKLGVTVTMRQAPGRPIARLSVVKPMAKQLCSASRGARLKLS